MGFGAPRGRRWREHGRSRQQSESATMDTNYTNIDHGRAILAGGPARRGGGDLRPRAVPARADGRDSDDGHAAVLRFGRHGDGQPHRPSRLRRGRGRRLRPDPTRACDRLTHDETRRRRACRELRARGATLSRRDRGPRRGVPHRAGPFGRRGPVVRRDRAAHGRPARDRQEPTLPGSAPASEGSLRLCGGDGPTLRLEEAFRTAVRTAARRQKAPPELRGELLELLARAGEK